MIERTYNIPLRKRFRNTARYKKTKKAVTSLKEFLSKHMKSDKIKIGKNLNNFLWKHGIKNPPHHVKVTVIKEDDGTVKAELLGFKYEHMTKAEKEKIAEKKEKTEKVKEEKKKESKNEENIDKTEIKEKTSEKENNEETTEKKEKPKTTQKNKNSKKEK